MNFMSTRNQEIIKSLSEAIYSGLAPDGGLYVPDYFPKVELEKGWSDLSYPEFAQKFMNPFFQNDSLWYNLSPICENAFNFDVPLKRINDNTFMLELFHGPTSSFKDF